MTAMQANQITLTKNKKYSVHGESCEYQGMQRMKGLGMVHVFKKNRGGQPIILLPSAVQSDVRPLRTYKHRFKLDDDRQTIKYGNNRLKSRRALYDFAVNCLKLNRDRAWNIMQKTTDVSAFVREFNALLQEG